MKSIGSLRFSSSQSLKSGRRRWWRSKAGRLSRRLTRCWSRELHQDLQNVRDETNKESVQDRQKRDSFLERQKLEQMQLKKQKNKNSDRNLKQCKERKEPVAEVHNEGFIFEEEKNMCKVLIGGETMSRVVSSESGILVQEFKLPASVIIGEVRNPTLTVETNGNDRKADILVVGKQEVGLDVSTDSAVEVDNFDSNKWPSDEDDCTDISLKEQRGESTEFVDSPDTPLDDCDMSMTQTKAIVEDTKLQQQQGTRIWIQKTDQEAAWSQNNNDFMKETKGEQEPTKEGQKQLTLSESRQNLGIEKELSGIASHEIQPSEEEMDEPKKVEMADCETSLLGPLNSATWTNESQVTEVEEKGEDVELVVSTNVDLIQSADFAFDEESEMTEESERSSEVEAESEQNIRSDLQMGVEKPALPEKPAFKLTLNEVVSDALIKKVLDQVDDGINFGESAQSPKGSPKLNRRPGALGQLLLPEEPSAMGRSRSGSTASQADDIELKRLEQELFNHCKVQETDPKANSGILLRELEKMGILRTDPRLTPLMETLRMIKRKTFGAIYGIDNIKLDFNQFQKVIKPSIVIIVKAFKGQLVIPEFDAFTKDITEVYERCRSHRAGAPADYIPQLARGDPNKWGVSLCTTDGQRYSIGDYQDHFSIQSTSKPFTYALALNHMGAEVVQKYIGREPSGRTFNEIALDYNGQPHNPMVNSGAIMSASLLLYMVKPELTVSEKFEYVHHFFSRMAGGQNVGFQNSTFLSERDTADRNNALAYFMREQGCFPNGPNNAGGGVDIKNILDFYFQTCSLEMNCESMSVMAGTLANGGICPITGERVLANEAVKNVLSLMYSCGMYNYSGQFAFQVGLPAKSGVSGIVLVVVPNVVGFATWSPPLDSIGNSARGVMFAEELVKIYNFHTFDSIGEHTSDKKNPKVQNYEEQSLKLVQLLFAASQGDKMALERAYLAGVDMNMGDYDGRTALHLACVENHPACVKYLIETCKVDLDVEDRWGNTPLQDAVRCNHPRIVAMLKKFRSLTGAPMMSTLGEESEEPSSPTKQTPTVTVNGSSGDPQLVKDPSATEQAAVKIQTAYKAMKERKERERNGKMNDNNTRVISM